ncbi:MAG: hypothetical protein ABJB11_19205 [Ferruginibacter sp.]
MKHFLSIIATIYIFSSCQIENNSHPDNFEVLLPDTTKTHRQNKTFDKLIDLGKQMNLPKLDTGVIGTDIRLWIKSMVDPNLVVTLSITDTSINAQKFDYYLSPDGVVHFKKTHRGFGGDSLQLLAEELNNIDFKNMISQNEIENFNDNIADGVNYDLEISTSKYYKLLSYHCPEQFAKTEINNKNFLNLVFILDRHLHFYSPICTF